MNQLTDEAVRTMWCETLRAVHGTSSELESELQSRHDLGLSEFEVLNALSGICGKPDGKAMMKDLEAKLYLSQSALSRTVSRLEKAGLVARAVCELDRRAMFLLLTPAGRDRWEQAAPTQLAVLRRNIHLIEELGRSQSEVATV